MRGLFILGVLALVFLAFGQEQVKFKVIDMPPEFTTIQQYKVMTIRNPKDWKAYWNRYVHANVEKDGYWDPMPMPSVDFKQNQVVAIHLGRQAESGMKLSVDSVVIDHGSATVTLKESWGPVVMHHTSNPAILVQIPKVYGPVAVVVNKEDASKGGDNGPRMRGFVKRGSGAG